MATRLMARMAPRTLTNGLAAPAPVPPTRGRREPWRQQVRDETIEQRSGRRVEDAAKAGLLTAAAVFAVALVVLLVGPQNASSSPWTSPWLVGGGLLGSVLCFFGMHVCRLPPALQAAHREGLPIGRPYRPRGAPAQARRERARRLYSSARTLRKLSAEAWPLVLFASSVPWWGDRIDPLINVNPATFLVYWGLRFGSVFAYLACAVAGLIGTVLVVTIARLAQLHEWPPLSHRDRVLLWFADRPGRVRAALRAFVLDSPVVDAWRRRPSERTLVRRLGYLGTACLGLAVYVVAVATTRSLGPPPPTTQVVTVTAFLSFSAAVAFALRQAVLAAGKAAPRSWASSAQQAVSVAKVHVEARAYLWTVWTMLGLFAVQELALLYTLNHATLLDARRTPGTGSARADLWRWYDDTFLAGLSPLTGVFSLLTVGAIALVISSYKEIATLNAARRPERQRRGARQGTDRGDLTPVRRRAARVAGHPRHSG